MTARLSICLTFDFDALSPWAFELANGNVAALRGLDALDQVAGVRPAGYRPPNVDVSVNSVELLLENGFAYDASFSGSDFTPYYLRTGDRVSPDGPFEFGETVDLVGIPFA